MTVAGASLFVRRRSESQPRLKPTGLDAEKLFKPAGVAQRGRQATLFCCLRRRYHSFSQTQVLFSCIKNVLSTAHGASSSSSAHVGRIVGEKTHCVVKYVFVTGVEKVFDCGNLVRRKFLKPNGHFSHAVLRINFSFWRNEAA